MVVLNLKNPISLSSEFNEILDKLEHSKLHYFITGKAGTGKSTLLKLFRNTTKKRVVVLAPTGIAALNVKGQTIHSFFGFPPKMIDPSEIKKRKFNRLYRNIDTIIIDEISMVRVDMLDNIDRFLRINRKSNEVFGGVQMIFFGDLFQLPPIIAGEFEKQHLTRLYESPYFFSSRAMQMIREDFKTIEMTKVYRQQEQHFVRLLDNIRTKFFDYDDLELLNSRHTSEYYDQDMYITLTSRNVIVDQINQKKLSEIMAAPYIFEASIIGDFNPKLYPTESQLVLKVGAQVMFVKNDPQKRFVNGTIGKVIELSPDKILVSITNPDRISKVIEIEKMEWEILKYAYRSDKPEIIETRVAGTFKQYPLKLAWAITIHKSQGKTFDRVIIDLGAGAFEYGQTYVALSRCRTLGGIVLKRKINPGDIIVDQKIADFYMNWH
jgi:ATP-dependent exoDNAse (exonuclease V) alpha subunit